MNSSNTQPHHIVIVGGGFAGLYAAKSLARAHTKVTLIDRRNFHLFQPLLYQVATGNVTPGDITSPLRSVLRRFPNVQVLLAEMVDIDPKAHKILLADGEISYDAAVIATGVQPHYFGNETWSRAAPGLKSIEDAITMRRQILSAFEAAERETDPVKRRAWMTFVVIGGGSAGVELGGAIGELAHGTLANDFRSNDPRQARVLLIEAADRILPSYPPALSAKAEASLAQLGVTVQTSTRVTELVEGTITVKKGDQVEQIQARTALWTAGIRATPIAKMLSQRTDAQLDHLDRVVVEGDLSVPGHPDIFVLGDLASFSPLGKSPLPAVAPVAIQEGRYVAKLIKARLKGKQLGPFRYFDKGNLAVIGRHAAVAGMGKLQFSGVFAWLVWVFIHIIYLIEFENRVLVMFRWAWNYVTRKRGARLITEGGPPPSTMTVQTPHA